MSLFLNYNNQFIQVVENIGAILQANKSKLPETDEEMGNCLLGLFLKAQKKPENQSMEHFFQGIYFILIFF